MGRVYLRTELDEDPRVLALAVVLNLHVFDVIGRLWKLWAYADTHSEDGLIAPATPALIDHIVATPGFAAALADPSIDWLVIHAAGGGRHAPCHGDCHAVDHVIVPRYNRHCGQSAKQRRQDRERQARHRAKKSGRHGEVTQASRVTVTPVTHSPATAPAPATNTELSFLERSGRLQTTEALADRIRLHPQIGPGVLDAHLLVHQLLESFPGIDLDAAIDDAFAFLAAGNDLNSTPDRFLRGWVARDRQRYVGGRKRALSAGEQSIENLRQVAAEIGGKP